MTEYMVYYNRVLSDSDDEEIVMRCCIPAEDEEDAIMIVRNMLKGRVYNLHAEACKSCK